MAFQKKNERKIEMKDDIDDLLLSTFVASSFSLNGCYSVHDTHPFIDFDFGQSKTLFSY